MHESARITVSASSIQEKFANLVFVEFKVVVKVVFLGFWKTWTNTTTAICIIVAGALLEGLFTYLTTVLVHVQRMGGMEILTERILEERKKKLKQLQQN